MRPSELLDNLYIHGMPIPAESWRGWAESDEFLGGLRHRFGKIGARAAGEALIARCMEDPGCQSFAALDASVRMVEMKSNHDQSMCCGAGGGRMWMEEKIGKRVNVARTEQALDTKAGIVAASCPFCMTMITDGVKTKEMQDKVRVMDIAELLDQAT